MLELAAREADIVAIMAAPITTGSIADDPRTRLEANFAEKVAGSAPPPATASSTSSSAWSCPSCRATIAPPPPPRSPADRSWNALSAPDVLDMPQFLIGTPGEMADALRRRRERLGISYLVVADRDLETAAPLVKQLTGS